MKKTVLTAALALMAVAAGAQTLAMPDTDTPGQPETEAAPAAPAPAPQAQHDTPSQSYKAERNDIRSGNKAFEKELYHEALRDYDKALEVNAGSIRARYNKAVTLLKLQSDDNKGTQNDPRVAARDLFTQLIPDARTYDPSVAQKAYYNLGNMAFNDEQYDNSIEMYKSALRLDPSDMQARENLRLAQLKKQEQENQDQNQDQNQDKDKEQEQQQQQDQQQQQQDQQEQQQQQQQQQQQPMTQSAQQILQSMQNKENQTRKKVQQQEPPAGRPQTDKPW